MDVIPGWLLGGWIGRDLRGLPPLTFLVMAVIHGWLLGLDRELDGIAHFNIMDVIPGWLLGLDGESVEIAPFNIS